MTIWETHAWVIWLEESNADALLLEKALRLSEVEGCVVWRGVPLLAGQSCLLLIPVKYKEPHQLVKKVIFSVLAADMVELHTLINARSVLGGRVEKSMSLRRHCPDSSSNGIISDQMPSPAHEAGEGK
nr:hypothetical protein CFP56_79524 [Quercus suber]